MSTTTLQRNKTSVPPSANQAASVMLLRNQFLAALVPVQAASIRHASSPILANVLIKADAKSGCLTLTATDLDIEVITSCPATMDADVEFCTTTPAAMLYEIVRHTCEEENAMVSMEYGEHLFLKAGRFESSCRTLPAESFPLMPEVTYSRTIEMSCELLKKAIDQTRVAISNNEVRYCLCGLYWHVTAQEGLSLVATDGHRLARFSFGISDDISDMPQVIIPKKTVLQLHRLLAESPAGARVMCHVSAKRIKFQIGSTILTSKLIDGQYPDYMRAIPVNNDKHMRVKTKSLLEALGRVTIVISDRNKFVTFYLSHQQLVLVSENPDLGSTKESVSVEYEGPELKISFNARYLSDIMLSIAQEEVIFSMRDAQSATIIGTPDDTKLLCVLMPVCL